MQHINNSYIRYANCWEDADLLLPALDIGPQDTVLSIGSAGDNSFSLLSQAPHRVIAVDVNAAQLHLIALKKAAFLVFDYSTFLDFLGFRPHENRVEYFAFGTFQEPHRAIICPKNHRSPTRFLYPSMGQ